MSDESFGQLRRANRHIEGLRRDVASLSRAMGVHTDALDTAATPGHVRGAIAQLERALTKQGPPTRLDVDDVSDRRRSTLRRVGSFLVRLKPACEEAALALSKSEAPRENLVSGQLMRLMDEAGDHADEVLLASLPGGGMVYWDDEVGAVELERDGVTLVLPNETPDDVVDVLFGMADALGVKPSRYTMRGLQAIVVGAILVANDVDGETT